VEASIIAAHVWDIIWVTGVLLCALAFLWYARAARKDNDRALLFTAGTAAAVFFVAAGAYVLWLW
jgi:hypothetical protein